MSDLVEEFINERVWAIVGASTDTSKFGNLVFRNLHRAGYQVYGVNPNGGQIEGHELYPTLADLPEKPGVVDTVVPPRVTEQIVRECANAGITRIWMQPGSESPEAIRLCEELRIKVVHHDCAMVKRKVWP